MMKNSPSAKLNPREKLKNRCPRKLTHAKINPLKVRRNKKSKEKLNRHIQINEKMAKERP